MTTTRLADTHLDIAYHEPHQRHPSGASFHITVDINTKEDQDVENLKEEVQEAVDQATQALSGNIIWTVTAAKKAPEGSIRDALGKGTITGALESFYTEAVLKALDGRWNGLSVHVQRPLGPRIDTILKIGDGFTGKSYPIKAYAFGTMGGRLKEIERIFAIHVSGMVLDFGPRPSTELMFDYLLDKYRAILESSWTEAIEIQDGFGKVNKFKLS